MRIQFDQIVRRESKLMNLIPVTFKIKNNYDKLKLMGRNQVVIIIQKNNLRIGKMIAQ